MWEIPTGKTFILWAGVLYNDTTKQQPIATYYPRDRADDNNNHIQLPLVLAQPAAGHGGCITDSAMCPFPVSGPARIEITDVNAGPGDTITIQLLFTEVDL